MNYWIRMNYWIPMNCWRHWRRWNPMIVPYRVLFDQHLLHLLHLHLHLFLLMEMGHRPTLYRLWFRFLLMWRKIQTIQTIPWIQWIQMIQMIRMIDWCPLLLRSLNKIKVKRQNQSIQKNSIFRSPGFSLDTSIWTICTVHVR